MKQQAGDLAKGKFENDRDSIVAGNVNGGYAHKTLNLKEVMMWQNRFFQQGEILLLLKR